MKTARSLRLATAAAAAFFVALTILSMGVAAQAPCWPRDRLAAELAERWGESPRGRGLTGAGVLIELFATRDGSGWTLVAVRADGRACPLAAGRDWHRPAPPTSSPAREAGPHSKEKDS